jgi:hypothetical protein
MLDVLIAGVVVVTLAGRDLREKGIVLATREGLLLLLGAEFCRYAADALVTLSAEARPGAEPKGAEPEAKVDGVDSNLGQIVTV